MLVLFGAKEAGCFREVAALYSDHSRQVQLQYAGQVRASACLSLTGRIHAQVTIAVCQMVPP